MEHTNNIVTFQMLLAGYSGALGRFGAAARGRDEIATFLPLFEALNWAVALDDRCAAHWAPEGEPLGWRWRERVPGAEVMRGLRWARNGVHHQWSDALRLSEGSQFPARFPMVFHEWVWRPASELPALDRLDARGEEAYREHLEGRSAEVTLAALGNAFDFLGQLLGTPPPPAPSSGAPTVRP